MGKEISHVQVKLFQQPKGGFRGELVHQRKGGAPKKRTAGAVCFKGAASRGGTMGKKEFFT